jgi:hypothetical protein
MPFDVRSVCVCTAAGLYVFTDKVAWKARWPLAQAAL